MGQSGSRRTLAGGVFRGNRRRHTSVPCDGSRQRLFQSVILSEPSLSRRRRILTVGNGQDRIAQAIPKGEGSRERTESTTSNYSAFQSLKVAAIALGILFFGSHSTADIRADSSNVPLFQVFKLIQTGPDTYDSGPSGRPTHHWKTDDKGPLVTVQSLNDFLLEADKKSVRVILNKKDASVVADSFQKYGVLGITAGDAATILMSSKPFDGSITFTDPVAAYLRQRFHVKPNTNELEPSQ